MQTKRHILTMLAVLIYTFSHAQTYSITGTLRDAKSGEPMAFTNCVLLRTADSTFVAGATTLVSSASASPGASARWTSKAKAAKVPLIDVVTEIQIQKNIQ